MHLLQSRDQAPTELIASGHGDVSRPRGAVRWARSLDRRPACRDTRGFLRRRDSGAAPRVESATYDPVCRIEQHTIDAIHVHARCALDL